MRRPPTRPDAGAGHLRRWPLTAEPSTKDALPRRKRPAAARRAGADGGSQAARHPRPAGDRPGEGPQDALVPARAGSGGFAVMAAVGTLNTLADPYGMIGMKLLPRATTSDRTIKADAIEALKQGPAARRPRQLALDALRAQVPRGEDRPADLQRRRQRHRRHRRRLGDDQLHRRHLAGRAAPRTSGCSTWSRSCRSRSRAAPPTSRAWRSTSARRAPGAVRALAPRRRREPHRHVLVGHGQGFAARHPQPRQGEGEGLQVPRHVPAGRHAQAAPVDREGVGEALPEVGQALRRPVPQRVQGARPRSAELLRAHAQAA